MLLLISSFLAGALTSLAPCMLTLLPVIVGSSVLPGDGRKLDRKKPYVIAFSLGLSVIIFTLLLKASTVLIGVDPMVWTVLSGVIVIVLGITMLFPSLWVRISARTGLEQGSNSLLARASKKGGLGGQILTGAALGPVFSSCSPVYALVLATVLPVNLALGTVYIIAFALGLSLALLAIALVGQKLTRRLGWTADPNGWFRRGLAILLVLVGLMVSFGYDKKFQTWAIDFLPFDVTDIEQKFLPGVKNSSINSSNSSNSKQGGKESSVNAPFNVDVPYAAPELRSINDWINSDGETLAGLKGKVVLVDFWTYSCINCQRTQLYLNIWHTKYHDDGLVILGLHAPEFAFEKVPDNVSAAVKAAKIGYPVGLDNDFATWRAYENRFWPAKYLIDKDGKVRYTHFGEGEYAETETAIQALLAESGVSVTEQITRTSTRSPASAGQTPETYLSYTRGERLANAKEVATDTEASYTLANGLNRNEWSLGGNWQIGRESSLSGTDARLQINFSGREVYLVMSGPAGARVSVSIDGRTVSPAHLGGSDVRADGSVVLDRARLYKLVKSDNFLEGKQLTLDFSPGITANAFTFGS